MSGIWDLNLKGQEMRYFWMNANITCERQSNNMLGCTFDSFYIHLLFTRNFYALSESRY